MKLRYKLEGFIKSMSGEAPTPEPTPESTAGGETPENEQINDELLTAFQADIESGTLELTEEAVKSWCETKGLSLESSQELWSMVSASLESEEQPHSEPDGDEGAALTTDVQKGGNKSTPNPDLIQFRKSMAGFKENQEIIENTLGALIDENKSLRSQVGKISVLEDEVKFLKSKIGVIESTPINQKRPGMNSNDIPDSGSIEGKDEIVALIMKGIGEKVLTMQDLHKFKVNNVQSDQVKQFLKSQRGNN